MSIMPGLMSGEITEGRADTMLEMIYSMVEEANQIHLDMLAASAFSHQSVFDDYDRLSQLDAHIEALSRIRGTAKHRLNVHYTVQ